MRKSAFFAALIFAITTSGNAEAGPGYNGPLSPGYTGHSVYYFYGSYNTLQAALGNPSDDTLSAVPAGYKFLPWYGNVALAQQYATEWVDGSSWGGGTQFPNSGYFTPYFAYCLGCSGPNIVSSEGDSPTGFFSSEDQSTDELFYAVAVSD